MGPGPTLATHPAPGGGRDRTREAERARTPLREWCSRREHDNRIISESDLQNMSDGRQTGERKQVNKRTAPPLKTGLNTPTQQPVEATTTNYIYKIYSTTTQDRKVRPTTATTSSKQLLLHKATAKQKTNSAGYIQDKATARPQAKPHAGGDRKQNYKTD